MFNTPRTRPIVLNADPSNPYISSSEGVFTMAQVGRSLSAQSSFEGQETLIYIWKFRKLGDSLYTAKYYIIVLSTRAPKLFGGSFNQDFWKSPFGISLELPKFTEAPIFETLDPQGYMPNETPLGLVIASKHEEPQLRLRLASHFRDRAMPYKVATYSTTSYC